MNHTKSCSQDSGPGRGETIEGASEGGGGHEVPSTHGESVLDAGIMLSDDVCQLMLIRYGGPNLQIDFVSFVHLMLRAENMEGELVGRSKGQDFLFTPRGLPTHPHFKQEGG